MNAQPNPKQEAAGHALVGLAALIVGAIVTDGKLAEAAFAAAVGVVIHAMFNRPVTYYITNHPQEFPRFLTQ